MKKRVISAIVMALITIPILIIGGKLSAIFFTALCLISLYELFKMRESKKKFPFLMKLFAYLLATFFCLSNFDSTVLVVNLDYRILTAIIFVFLIPIVFINDNDKYNIQDALFLVGSFLFLGLSFNLLITIRNFDLNYVLYILAITVFTDIFAFIVGKYIGSHKLAPKISPNKTIEGLIGGLAMGTFVATVFYCTVIGGSLNIFFIILITLALSFVGQIGDLVFSSIKRYYGKKDFSNFLPGHGGILDRCDSLIFVSLAFILVMAVL